MAFLGWIGQRTARSVTDCGRAAELFTEALRWTFRRPFRLRLFLDQCLAVGVRSVPVVLITGGFTGAVLALQTVAAFRLFGAENLVASVVSLSMTREIGPVLTGMMVAGRVGSAMAAEIGSMRVTEQVDALHSLATNPVQYLVVPRLWAAFVTLPGLVIFSNVIGVIGGRFVAVDVLGNSGAAYDRRTVQFLEVDDVMVGLLKAALFGLMLALVGCYQGYSVRGGAREVAFAVNRAVVVSVALILVINYLVTAYLFG